MVSIRNAAGTDTHYSNLAAIHLSSHRGWQPYLSMLGSMHDMVVTGVSLNPLAVMNGFV